MSWNEIHRVTLEQGGEIDFGAVLTPPVMYHFKSNGKILDLGCGHGLDAVRLTRAGFRVTALDVSSAALEKAKENARDAGFHLPFDRYIISFVEADIANGLPFANARFGGVLANLSLHYFTLERTWFIISEIARVLKPNGVLVAHLNAITEGEERRARGQVVSEPEPGQFLERDGVTRRYFAREDFAGFLWDWLVVELELLEIPRREGKIKHCWRVVAKR